MLYFVLLLPDCVVQVYGETSYDLITEVIKHTKLSENDVFLDLGSGESSLDLLIMYYSVYDTRLD